MHKNLLKTAALTFIVILILSGTTMASLFSKNLDAAQFQELISTLPKENAAERMVKRVNISNIKLPLEQFENIHFKSCEWNEIIAQSTHFKHTTFENCALSNVNMREASFDDVTFVNCTLHNVVMNGAKATKIEFIDSKLTSADPNIQNSYRNMLTDELIFNNSELTGLNFFESKAVFRFIGSKLIDVSGMGLLPGSALYFDKVDASLLDFSQSDLTNIEVIDSNIGARSNAGGGKVKNILVKNSQLDFVLAFTSDADSIIYRDSGNVINGNSKNTKTISIIDCPNNTSVIDAGSNGFDLLEIENCDVSNLIFTDSIGKAVSLNNVSTRHMDFRESNIKHLILDNVRIRDYLEYTDTHVDRLETKNITMSTRMKIYKDGANFEITPDHLFDKNSE